jgi:hypothetical protein
MAALLERLDQFARHEADVMLSKRARCVHLAIWAEGAFDHHALAFAKEVGQRAGWRHRRGNLKRRRNSQAPSHSTHHIPSGSIMASAYARGGRDTALAYLASLPVRKDVIDCFRRKLNISHPLARQSCVLTAYDS